MLLLKDLVSKCYTFSLDIFLGPVVWSWDLSNKCTMDSVWLQQNESYPTSRESLGHHITAIASLTLKRRSSKSIRYSSAQMWYDKNLSIASIIQRSRRQSLH